MNSHLLKRVFADLHLHIGRTESGEPVKISGSRDLTFRNIAHESAVRKGIGLLGIIDCHSPGVQVDIARLLDNGEMTEVQRRWNTLSGYDDTAGVRNRGERCRLRTGSSSCLFADFRPDAAVHEVDGEPYAQCTAEFTADLCPDAYSAGGSERPRRLIHPCPYLHAS